jgi:GDP-4-dehydro-6-deoxy-D-mannose reductase
MRSLITGVGGFAGQHLAAHLLAHGHNVWGAVRRKDVDWHIPTIPAAPRFRLVLADLLEESQVRHAFEQAQPDRIYHLASQSFVPESFADPIGTLVNNTTSIVHVLQNALALTPSARVLIVSSSEIYGSARDAAPIDEQAELRPGSPYAVSKATQDLLGYQYHVAHGLDVVRVRPFNYIGPGQSDRFVASSFARQIAEAEAGRRAPELSVGNLGAQRDFTDVRDMVAAFDLALSHGETGAAYNVGRGEATSIQQLLDLLRARSQVPISVRVDSSRLRPSDAPVSICDAHRFRERTGWQPTFTLAATLDDTLRYWRHRLRA